jgi:hypothetical protein
MSHDKAVGQLLSSFCGFQVYSPQRHGQGFQAQKAALFGEEIASHDCICTCRCAGRSAKTWCQRKHIREATHKELSKYDEYGPMFCEVALEGEQPCTATIVNLHALLFAAFGQGGGFYKLLKDTMQKTPPTPHSPYQLILYSDEVVPGNVLSADNRRKCWLVYASIAQFGAEVLSQECAWLTLACCRSSFLTHCFAGIGQLMKAIIQKLFSE